MAMYNFNLDAVGDALLAAHTRGVRVRIVARATRLTGVGLAVFRTPGSKSSATGAKS